MGVTSRIAAFAAVFAAALALPTPEPVAIARPNFDVQSKNPANILRRATSVNYNQDYVASGANVQYSPNESTGTFSVNYNTNADFVVGLGWTTGDST
jgi:endo-1,4-beta-xylanase